METTREYILDSLKLASQREGGCIQSDPLASALENLTFAELAVLMVKLSKANVAS
jgi:hypothetical protein